MYCPKFRLSLLNFPVSSFSLTMYFTFFQLLIIFRDKRNQITCLLNQANIKLKKKKKNCLRLLYEHSSLMTTSQLVETTLRSDSLWTFSHTVPLPGMSFLFLSIYIHITTKVCIYKHAFNLSKCCLSASLTHSRCFVMLAIYFFHMVLSSFVQRLYPVSAVPYSIKRGPL